MRILSKKRRIENKTNYSKRMRLLENAKPRIIIRKTNKYITLQLAESISAQDKIIASVNSKELLEHGWTKEREGSLKSLGAAYLSGFLFGKKISSLKIKGFVIDTGLIRNTKGSKVYAAIKGIKDSGIGVNIDPEVIPSEERIKNPKIANFFEKVKLNIEKLKSGGK